MRRPTIGAMDRATVSTSGSSGTLGELDQDVVTGHPHRERLDLFGGIEIVRPSGAVPLPGVPGTHDKVAVDGALPQWTAAMRAGAVQRGDASGDVTDSVNGIAGGDFCYGAGGQLGELCNFDQGHAFRDENIMASAIYNVR